MPIHLRIHKPELGISVLTMPVHQRTLQFFLGYMQNFHRVWLPHLTFVFSYRKVANGWYYGGYYDGGLRVLASDSPFENLHNDKFSYFPTEEDTSGLACTPHQWDQVYPNLSVMFGTVLDVWSQMVHSFNLRQHIWCDWDKMTLEQVSENLTPKMSRLIDFYPQLVGEKLLNHSAPKLRSLRNI